MNAPEKVFGQPAQLPDIQATPDRRNLAIQQVGVKGVRHPVHIRTADGSAQPSVATFDLYVALPPQVKGTHMSRFVELLEAHAGEALEPASLRVLLADMLERLGAETGEITLRFTYFMRKIAPVSGVSSLMDYEVTLHVAGRAGETARVRQTAYFSDRGRLIQADRGRRIGVAVAALEKCAGPSVTVS